MILFKKKFMTLAELRYGLGPGKIGTSSDFPGVDALTVLHCPQPLPGATCRQAHTLVADLTRELEVLRAELKKNTRNEISRATEKDGLKYDFFLAPEPGDLDRFMDFFGDFSTRKRIAAPGRPLLNAYARAGCLVLSSVSSPNESLTWHAYFSTQGRVRLLHSASLRLSTDDKEFRQLLGRANRFHHWQDWVRFKSEGIRIYDWGGISLSDQNPEQKRISEFKQGFGGVAETSYNCELPLTLKGAAYYFLRNRFYRFRSGA